MKRSVFLYIGPPGTGKTEALLKEVEAAIERGVSPKRIAYLAFTRAGALEAKRRVVNRFPHYGEGDFIWFRTIHSAAFRLRGMGRDEIMNKKNWTELGDALGTTFAERGDNRAWTVFESGSLGDRCLKIHALSIARGISLREAWESSDEEGLAYQTIENFREELTEYKRSRGIVDFTDLLIIPSSSFSIPEIDVGIIDEAQDLTDQQWRFVRTIFRTANSIIIAGDDDQQIYQWAGASADGMLSFRSEKRVLPVSHRLPKRIKDLSEDVVSRITDRIPKTFRARPGAEGEVRYIRDWDEAPLREGKWLLLARHHYQLTSAVEACRSLGVVYLYNGRWSNSAEEIRAVIAYERLRKGDRMPFSEARLICSWIVGAPTLARVPGLERYGTEEMGLPEAESLPNWMEGLTRLSPGEKEYIRSLRRNGEALTGEGRIEINTIHGAKGWEAPNVILALDYSKKVERMMRKNGEDDETRVFFVGMTRAKETLFLIQPKTNRAFRI